MMPLAYIKAPSYLAATMITLGLLSVFGYLVQVFFFHEAGGLVPIIGALAVLGGSILISLP
jgi:drug/metabolite transporter (DMT)-like permease